MIELVSLKRILTVAVPYGALLASLNLFGYWGAFKINVLEHIGLADIAKLSIYPLLASLLFFLVGFALMELMRGNSLPPGGGEHTAVGQFGRKHWRGILSLQVIAIVVIAIFFQEPYKWSLVAFLIALFGAPLSHLDIAIELAPNPRLRQVVLFLLLWIPGLAFHNGRLDAHLIKTGHGALIIDAARSSLPLSSAKGRPISYLGRLGDQFVIYEAVSGSVVLINAADYPSLFLLPNPERS